MSRAIAFRTYVPELRKMVDVFAVNPMNQTVYLSHIQLFGTEGDDVLMKFGDEPDQVKLMHNTGLCDRNGVQIYDGDILTVNLTPANKRKPVTCRYRVEWGNRAARFFFRAVRRDVGTISPSRAMVSGRVIGNIYENPELLEVAS